MKAGTVPRLVILSLVVTACSSAICRAKPTRDELYLRVTIVTGEHSRDSNSVTRTLIVSSGKLLYEETYEGARSNRHEPVKKQYKLTTQDQASLIALLKTKNLLLTSNISKPPTQKGFSRYFELSITSRLDGKENTVAIDGSPSATELRTESLYQSSVDLIEQLYKIINRTDPDIAAPTLID
jgi:hypothetical protein